MDDYLSKPLHLNELRSMLEKWLPQPLKILSESQHRANIVNELGSHKSINTIMPTNNPQERVHVIWDADMPICMLGDNPSMRHRVLEKFLVNSQAHIASISVALKVSDTRKIADVAHKLKSAARTVGAFRLGELCQELEYAERAEDLTTCQKKMKTTIKTFSATLDTIKADWI